MLATGGVFQIISCCGLLDRSLQKPVVYKPLYNRYNYTPKKFLNNHIVHYQSRLGNKAAYDKKRRR